jgi:hypothetical protein
LAQIGESLWQQDEDWIQFGGSSGRNQRYKRGRSKQLGLQMEVEEAEEEEELSLVLFDALFLGSFALLSATGCSMSPGRPTGLLGGPVHDT